MEGTVNMLKSRRNNDDHYYANLAVIIDINTQVGANRSVLVNENSSAVISQSSLHILNPHIPPTDIVYTLTRPPRHGYLAIDPVQANGKYFFHPIPTVTLPLHKI